MPLRRKIAGVCFATAGAAALALPGEGTARPLLAKATLAAVAAPHYALTDLGTFGGPHAELNGPAVQMTGQGAVLGLADTRTPDTDYALNGPGADPFIAHAFSWQNGHLTDLGALPGNNSSAVFEVNSSGIGAGVSETGAIDPLTGTPEAHTVLFDHGTVQDLGTLPGGTESFAVALNDSGQVAGMSNNGIPDQFSANFFPWVTQVRSFVWQNGVMHDLGTLGGPDATLSTINAHGQVAGDSYTSDTPNPTTKVPTIHPYLWQNGQMHDLGSLGGTSSLTWWLNDAGEVVGQDNLVGDKTYHPFLWDGTHLRDLGTLGGANGAAIHINDAGDVTGWARTAGGAEHTFLWTNGTKTDLTGASSTQWTHPEWLNEADQIVGYLYVGNSSHALLWTGGHQYDLNTLVGPTHVDLTEAAYINDGGEITALGILPNGHQHVFLLKPLGPNACEVPKLRGKTLRRAKHSVRSHDCTVGVIKHATSRTIKKGRVISQNPKPGIWLTHGAKVDVVVSKGRR